MLGLAKKMLIKDWKMGELKVLVASVLVAVASITTIGVFVERVQYSIERQASSILGGDRRVSSRIELDPSWRKEAEKRQLAVSEGISLVTMMSSDEKFQLVYMQAIDEQFPLRGAIKLADKPFAPGEAVSGAPPSGSIWVNPKLLPLLNIQVGDSVQLGDKRVKVAALVVEEPGGGAEVFNVAPNIYLNQSDLAATALIQPGSRITYNLLLAGNSQSIKGFDEWLRPQLNASQNLLGGKNSSQALGRAFERSDKYLHLAAIVSVLLAGVAIAMASQRYAQRHFDSVAIFRCLGASRRQALSVFMLVLVFLSILVSAFGVAFGFGFQAILFELLKGYFPIEIDYVVVKPIIVGLLTGVVIILGFSAPSLLRLSQVSPLRVLRRDLAPMSAGYVLIYTFSLLTLSGLLFWYTGNAAIVLAFLLVSPLLVFLFMAVSKVAIAVASRLTIFSSNSYRFGLRQLHRFRHASQIQIAALSFAILIVMVVLYVRSDLLQEWQAKIPDDSPNYFIINIQPEQVEGLQAFFAQRNVVNENYYPMIRGRLSAVNGVAVEERYGGDGTRHNSLRRELNLSWSETLQSSNQIIEGDWHGGDPEFISVESRMAERLGIGLGDKLTFTITGQDVTKTINSIREVDWDSFQPNFYVIFGKGVLDRFSQSFITSTYLPKEKRATLVELVKAYPTLTVIDLDPIMNQVKNILAQVTLAVEFIFAFTFVSGLVVLIASIESTQDERQRNSVIVRTLGASRRFIASSISVEMVCIGILAGVLAAGGTELIGFVLARWVFTLEPSLHPWLWIVGPIMGVLATWVTSIQLVRTVANQAPLKILRRLNS